MFDFKKGTISILKNYNFVKTELKEKDREMLYDFYEGLFSGFDEEGFDTRCDYKLAITQIYFNSDSTLESVYVDIPQVVNSHPFASFYILHNGKHYNLVISSSKIISIDNIEISSLIFEKSIKISHFDYETGKKIGIEAAKDFNEINHGLSKAVFDSLIMFMLNAKNPAFVNPSFNINANSSRIRVDGTLLTNPKIKLSFRYPLKLDIEKEERILVEFNLGEENRFIMINQDSLLEFYNGRIPGFE